MDNIEQFSLYTAKIFKELYDSFPIPVGIDRNEMISDCLLFNKDDELQSLKNKKEMASLAILAGRNGKTNKMEEGLLSVQGKHSELENEKSNEIGYQTAVFNNTLEFLIFEGLIRTPEDGGYVLTAKAFSHLNMNFDNGALNDNESSYIKTIKGIFANATEKVGIGVAVKIIPSLLGINQ